MECSKNKKLENCNNTILRGQYHSECKDWIDSKLLYNYPLSNNKQFDASSITGIELHARGRIQAQYCVKSFKIIEKDDLIKLGYPREEKLRAKNYVLFSLLKVSSEVLPRTDYIDKIRNLHDYVKESRDWAILSHWLHLINNPYGKVYERQAKRILPKELFSELLNPNINVRETQELLFPEIFKVPFLSSSAPTFRFIDLFAGIGGFRIAGQNAGGQCVFSSEWDEYAARTYEYNFGETPFGDITKIKAEDIPPFDFCFAGFPCQAFSLAGQKKGFDDDYKGRCRGTLFLDVARICKFHSPKIIFCENVKGLVIHDKGRTFNIIKETFKELGYTVFSAVLNSKDFGVPQNRERVYIVAFRNDIAPETFDFPTGSQERVSIRDVLEQQEVSVKYYLSTQYIDTLVKHKARHESKGNGFGYQIRDLDDIAGAIVCGGMGRERNLIVDKRQTSFVPITHIKGEVNRDGIRKMTPREWARLQGFPEDFLLSLADVHLYKQFGNSITVPVVESIINRIQEVIP